MLRETAQVVIGLSALLALPACQRRQAEQIAPRPSTEVDRYSLHVKFEVKDKRPPLDAHVPVVLDTPFKVSHTTDDGIEIEVSGTVSSPIDGKYPTTIKYWYGRPGTPVHQRNPGFSWSDLELGKGKGRGFMSSGVIWNWLYYTLSKTEPLDAEPSRAADAAGHSDGRDQ